MKTQDRKPSHLPLIISLLIFVGLFAAYFFIPSVKIFLKEAFDVLTSDDAQRINNWVATFGLWGPLVIILAMILQLFLIIIPSVLIMIIAVLAYGPWIGTLITICGVFLSATTGYIIGDYLGDVGVERLLGEKTIKKIEDYVKSYGLWTVIVFRASPFLSNDAISFVGGFVEMTYKRFILATLLGSSPLLLLVAIYGQSVDKLKPGLIIGSVLSILVLLIYIYMDKRKKRVKEN